MSPMEMTTQASPTAAASMPQATIEPRKRTPIRLWIMAAILTAFWIFEFSIYSIEMAMFPRFISRMLVYAVLLLVCLGWWLTNRHLLWRDRLLGIGLLVFGTVIGSLLADQSARGLLVMGGYLRLFTAWIFWLLVTQNRSLAIQRIGLCVATVLVFGYYTLIRWDGLDGAQRAKMSWRWSPTPEQLFLTQANRVSEPEARRPAASAQWTVQPADWPDFRSDERDTGLAGVQTAENWSKQPPPLVWRRRVGPGWSSMIVVDGHLVTQEQRGESEAVACYDAATGGEIWTHHDADRFEEPLAGAGPRGTPAFSDRYIFALGAKGKLNCLQATTGEVVWQRDLLTETEAAVPQWGLSVSPLVVDDLVIVFAGGKGDRGLIAYRAASGEPVWSRATGDMSYSSPQLATLAGERQILMHDNVGLHAFSVESGQLLWQQASNEGGGQPMLQPHVLDASQLLIPWGSGIALIEVQRDGNDWRIERRWESSALKPGFNDFVVCDGHLYGLDDGILCCLDAATGRRLWKKGRFGHGQMLLLASPARLLVLSETGEVVLLAANPKQYEELGRFQAIEGKTWNHPVIAHGCLYVRNGAEMACYRLAPGP
jgi:outer membrane protein assembly factor BamB